VIAAVLPLATAAASLTLRPGAEARGGGPVMKVDVRRPGAGVALSWARPLVQIAGIENPLTLFVAGSDALALITSVVEERLKAMRDNEEPSGSTDGVS